MASNAPGFTEGEWTTLGNHLGYGNPASSLGFLGMEERLNGDRDTDLRWRLTNLEHPIGRLPVPSEGTLPNTPTWPLMAKLARLLVDNADDWRDREKATEYVRTSLGVPGQRTFLCELFPLPERDRRQFSYGDRYPSQQAYHAAVLDDRKRAIRELADAPPWKTIICYGREFWDHYKGIWDDVEFDEYEFPYAKRRAFIAAGIGNSATIVLTPFFRPSLFPLAVVEHLPEIIDEHTLHVIT